MNKLLALVVVAGCADAGRDGSQGPAGPPGPQGPVGAAGARLVWKTSNGTVVANAYASLGEISWTMTYLDSSGVSFTIDPLTGEPNLAYWLDVDSELWFYPTATCSGAPAIYGHGLTPMTAFQYGASYDVIALPADVPLVRSIESYNQAGSGTCIHKSETGTWIEKSVFDTAPRLTAPMVVGAPFHVDSP